MSGKSRRSASGMAKRGMVMMAFERIMAGKRRPEMRWGSFMWRALGPKRQKRIL